MTDAFAKRVMDVTLASLLLWLSAPLWPAIALAIRLTSPGPILYRASRIGQGGQPFTMYKFRSMRVGAGGLGITGAGDARITPVGRVLRGWKLDEIPQLLNVLRGEMSLVGPRPEAPEYVALYTDEQRAVLAVKPGITGPTQLRFRHEERLLAGQRTDHLYRTQFLPAKLASDLDYLETHTLISDLKIMLQTVRQIASR